MQTALSPAKPAGAPPAPARRAAAGRHEPLWMVLFDPGRFATMRQMAGILLKSGFLPRAIRTEEQVITILIKGCELGLPPMEALTGIVVIDGKPAVSPQLMLSLINRSGELRDIAIDSDDQHCTVTMTRRGRRPHTETFTLGDARRMGLAGRDNWLKQPRVMLRWRAVSACARIVFPDVISGLYTFEEMDAPVTVDDDGAMRIADDDAAPPDMPRQGSGGAPPSGALLPDPDAGRAPEAGPAPEAAAAPAPEPGDADELAAILRSAAAAAGHDGADAVRQYLASRYRLDTDRVEDIPAELRGRIRADAVRLLADEDAQPGGAEPSAAATGAAESPAQDAPAEAPAAGGVSDSELMATIHKAATALRVKHPNPGLAWLRAHYKADAIAALTPQQRADAYRRALEILNARAPRQAPSGSSAAPRAARPRAGANGERRELAQRGGAAPTAELPAATALRAAFERDQEPPERQEALIREFTRGRACEIAQMTEAEIRALLSERWPELPATP
jgi:hypothetical protein